VMVMVTMVVGAGASFLAAVLTEMYLCASCSCHEILRAQRRGSGGGGRCGGRYVARGAQHEDDLAAAWRTAATQARAEREQGERAAAGAVSHENAPPRTRSTDTARPTDAAPPN
jgi:hypothetical protein